MATSACAVRVARACCRGATSVLLCVCVVQLCRAATWHVCEPAMGWKGTGVCPTDAYTTIQSALDAAADGDTVLVGEGNYKQTNSLSDLSMFCQVWEVRGEGASLCAP